MKREDGNNANIYECLVCSLLVYLASSQAVSAPADVLLLRGFAACLKNWAVGMSITLLVAQYFEQVQQCIFDLFPAFCQAATRA